MNLIVIKKKYYWSFEGAATALEKVRSVLGHGATCAYAGLPVPPNYWEYAGALATAEALYDREHPDYPCGAVPVHEGNGRFVHVTCTGNTEYTLAPCGPEWVIEVRRREDAAPIGGGWNEDIATALGVDWSDGPWNYASWERAQEVWKEAREEAAVEVTPVSRPDRDL